MSGWWATATDEDKVNAGLGSLIAAVLSIPILGVLWLLGVI